MDWDKLRYVLAVYRAGSLTGAADMLHTSHPTVLRKLNALETELGSRLFERSRSGMVVTAIGEELALLAEDMEGRIEERLRAMAGFDQRLSGSLRVTTTDTLSFRVIPSIVAQFSKAYPDVMIDIEVSNQLVNLSKRHADIAIRPASSPPETLVGRKASIVASAIYGEKHLLAEYCLDSEDAGPGMISAEVPWVGPGDQLENTSFGKWTRRLRPAARNQVRVSSLMSAFLVAEQGVGLAAIPCFLGDMSPVMRRVSSPIPELESELWILTHRDVSRMARVRAFSDFAYQALQEFRAAFRGDLAGINLVDV